MQINSKGPEDAVLVQAMDGDSQQVRDIALEIMPEWLDLFARKNADYGSEGAKVLGVKGQYADMNRKMLKLKRAVWDDEPMNFEGPEEICLDLIGHLFLTVQMMREKEYAEQVLLYGDKKLREAAEESLKKQVHDAFTAGRLSMLPDPGTEDMPPEFEYSPGLQQIMLDERRKFARRVEMVEEVEEFEEKTGFMEFDEADKVKIDGDNSLTMETAAKNLSLNLPSGVYEVDPDGAIYRVHEHADREPMALVPVAAVRSITDTVQEDK